MCILQIQALMVGATCFQAVYVYLVIYTICLPVVKISILIFYVRIFSTRRFKQLAYTLIIFSAMWSISAFWVAVFQCSPVKAFWDKSIDGKCINSFDWLMAEGGITILTDIALLVMPMPMVWKLKISQQQKIALSGVFLLGGLCVIPDSRGALCRLRVALTDLAGCVLRASFACQRLISCSPLTLPVWLLALFAS